MFQELNEYLISIYKGYLYSSLHIAVCAVILFWGVHKTGNTPIPIFFFVFSTVFIFYNICQMIGIIGMAVIDMNERQKWIGDNMTEICIAMGILGVGNCFILFSHTIKIQPIIFLGIISILYLWKGRFNIWLKPIFIALSWFLIQDLLPYKLPNHHFSNPLSTFFFIFTLCLMYDAKDILIKNDDSIYKRIGANYTGFLMILISLITTFFTFHFVPLIIGSLLFIFRKKTSESWHLFVTDSYIIVYSTVLYLS